MHILIFSSKQTSRLQYVFSFIFRDILGVQCQFTSVWDEFISFQGVKINYSRQYSEEGIYFHATSLLLETQLNPIDVDIFEYKGEKVFFPTNRQSLLPFDPFAASFYLISRYEEYLPQIRDTHNRYKAEDSLAYKHDFLKKPVVDIWAMMIKELITTKYPDFPFPSRAFRYIQTVDVDLAYAYIEKGFLRTIFSYLKALYKMDLPGLLQRFKTHLGKIRDPYDTFDYLLEMQTKYNIQALYFLLMANYGHFDKNISHHSRKFQSLIKHLSDYAEVGTHFSYASNTNPALLQTELSRLNEITNREIFRNRQHFLMLYLPYTYKKLIDLDIREDYTMGYATQEGFRAGTCTPFIFYDINLEQETPLRIFPFAFMDGTFITYKKLSASEGYDRIKLLMDEVKKVNGTMISLWHNHTLCEAFECKGWRDTYERSTIYAMNNK